MKKKVIVVSPIIGNRVISGPAGILMKFCGFIPSSKSIIEMYKDIMDVFIFDDNDNIIDEDLINKYSTLYNIKFIRTNIILNSTDDKYNLANLILSISKTI